MTTKVVQIAIERGTTLEGNDITALWALTEEGDIFCQVRGKWEHVRGPEITKEFFAYKVAQANREAKIRKGP